MKKKQEEYKPDDRICIFYVTDRIHDLQHINDHNKLKKAITEFKDEKGVKAKEGDIITFPAFLFHRSKPNISKKRKTIISFNSSIFWYHEYPNWLRGEKK